MKTIFAGLKLLIRFTAITSLILAITYPIRGDQSQTSATGIDQALKDAVEIRLYHHFIGRKDYATPYLDAVLTATKNKEIFDLIKHHSKHEPYPIPVIAEPFLVFQLRDGSSVRFGYDSGVILGNLQYLQVPRRAQQWLDAKLPYPFNDKSPIMRD